MIRGCGWGSTLIGGGRVVPADNSGLGLDAAVAAGFRLVAVCFLATVSFFAPAFFSTILFPAVFFVADVFLVIFFFALLAAFFLAGAL